MREHPYIPMTFPHGFGRRSSPLVEKKKKERFHRGSFIDPLSLRDESIWRGRRARGPIHLAENDGARELPRAPALDGHPGRGRSLRAALDGQHAAGAAWWKRLGLCRGSSHLLQDSGARKHGELWIACDGRWFAPSRHSAGRDALRAKLHSKMPARSAWPRPMPAHLRFP